MATVYRAVQHSLGRPVAIKVLARGPDDQDEFARRFKKEGRILAQLLHPNIVTIYDVGVSEDNQLFLSMEYLSGSTLRDRIKLGLSFDSAIHIVRSIAKTLGYAHAKGVIHRDVKPSNVMFRHDGTPVLTDFGVARMVIGSNTVRTMTGLTVGSPGYMSPEQAMGQGATIQSDLYSLGVVLYEMLAGYPPYQADNSLAVVLKHLQDPIPPLPREHANLQPILNKLLAKKPSDRYRDTHEFLGALDCIVPSDTGSQPKATAGGSPLAVVEFASGTLRNLLRKRPRWSLWMGLIGATLLVIVVVYVFRSRTSTESIEALPKESPQPVASTAPVSRETEIATLLHQGEARLQAGLLTDEAEQSAEAAYRRVLKLDQGNAQALAGLENIAGEYERLARQLLEAGTPQESLDPIQKGLAVAPGREGLVQLRQEVEQRIAERQARKAEQERQQERQLQAEQFLEQARSSFAEGLLEISQAHIEQGLLAVPDQPDLLALREQVKARMAERQRQEEARRREEEAARRRTEEANRFLAQALESRRNGGYAVSLQHIDKGLALVPDHAELMRLREVIRAQLAAEQQRQAEQAKREQEITALLKQADARMQAKRWTEPAGNNAEATYRQVLKLDAGNVQAQAGLARIAQVYEQQARQRRDAGALQDSLGLVDKGLAVVPNHEGLLQLREEVSRGIAEAKARQSREEEQRQQAEHFLTQARSSFQQGAWEASLTQIDQGLTVMSGHPGLLSLREQVKTRMAEQARQQEEATRRQAAEVERQKAEQARQQAEAARRRQEADQSLARAVESQRNGKYADSLQQIEKGLVLIPAHPELTQLRDQIRAQQAAEQKQQAEQVKRDEEIRKLLDQAETQFKAKRLTEPAGNNAEATYRKLLKLDANNAQAQAGLVRIAQDYLQQAQQKKEAGALQDSQKLIEKGLIVIPNQSELIHLQEEVRVQSAVEQQKLEQQQQADKQRQEEKQRQEQQQKEQQRLKQQQEEKQRQEQKKKIEQQPIEKMQPDKKQQDQQHQEQQRLEQQRLEEKQRKEQQRREQQRQEEKQHQEQQKRVEQQRSEQQRKEQQRLDQQRLEQQRQEQQRKLEQQRQEPQRKEPPPEKQPAPETTTKPRVFGTF